MKSHRDRLPSVSVSLTELNAQQTHFLAALLELGGGAQNGPAAALMAGYSESHEGAARAARILLQSPKIMRALKNAVVHRFEVAASAAVETLVSICTDPKAPANARISAAQEILARSIGAVPSRTQSQSVNLTAYANVEELFARLDAQEARERGDTATEVIDTTAIAPVAEDQEE